MSATLGVIASSELLLAGALELRSFTGPRCEPALQLTPIGPGYVQLDRDAARRLAAILEAWAARR